MGAPVVSQQLLSWQGSLLDASFLHILHWLMSLVCKFWKSLFNFSTKGADQCPNCQQDHPCHLAGTHIPPLQQEPSSPGVEVGAIPAPHAELPCNSSRDGAANFCSAICCCLFYLEIWHDVLFLFLVNPFAEGKELLGAMDETNSFHSGKAERLLS